MNNLSVCLIVKNEEKYLSGCLKSIKDIAEEIILVDTGSTDQTIEIAKTFPCKIFNYYWDNNFSKVRNFAIEQANCEFIFFIDADEVFDSNSVSELKNCLKDNSAIAYNV